MRMDNLVELCINLPSMGAKFPTVANVGLLPRLESFSFSLTMLPRKLLQRLDGGALTALVIGTLGGEDFREIVRFKGLGNCGFITMIESRT